MLLAASCVTIVQFRPTQTMDRYVAPGSLRHIITSNPRKRLYVHPSLWTIDHVQLLNCQLVSTLSGSPSTLSAEASCFVSELAKHETVDKTVACLSGCVTKSSKDGSIERFVRALIPLIWRGLHAPKLER
jgi:hypothetical protein